MWNSTCFAEALSDPNNLGYKYVGDLDEWMLSLPLCVLLLTIFGFLLFNDAVLRLIGQNDIYRFIYGIAVCLYLTLFVIIWIIGIGNISSLCTALFKVYNQCTINIPFIPVELAGASRATLVFLPIFTFWGIILISPFLYWRYKLSHPAPPAPPNDLV